MGDLNVEGETAPPAQVPLARLFSRTSPFWLVLLLLAGCSGGDKPDMVLEITFEGDGCEGAMLDTVEVSFETGDLGDFSFSCDSSGPLKVRIPDLPTGTHRLLVLGIDQGAPIYALRVEIDHLSSGPHTYSLDLRLATEVVTYFTFAGAEGQDGLSCEQARIERLDIEVGELSFRDVPCSSQGVDGASLLGITPGSYDVSLSAFDSSGRELYSSTFPELEIHDGANEFLLNLLPQEKGDLEFFWLFGSDEKACDEARVVTIKYHLEGPDGVSEEVEEQCENADGHFWEDLEPGFYVLKNIEGLTESGATSHLSSNVPLYVAAGFAVSFEVVVEPLLAGIP